MGTDRRDQCSSRLVTRMSVPGVVDDEPRRRDDTRPSKHDVDQREVRPAELVGEGPVGIERVRSMAAASKR